MLVFEVSCRMRFSRNTKFTIQDFHLVIKAHSKTHPRSRKWSVELRSDVPSIWDILSSPESLLPPEFACRADGDLLMEVLGRFAVASPTTRMAWKSNWVFHIWNKEKLWQRVICKIVRFWWLLMLQYDELHSNLNFGLQKLNKMFRFHTYYTCFQILNLTLTNWLWGLGEWASGKPFKSIEFWTRTTVTSCMLVTSWTQQSLSAISGIVCNVLLEQL